MLRIFSGLFLLMTSAPLSAATSCSPPPLIDPTKGFIANFNNPCYALPLQSSSLLGESGDPNALYDQVYYQVTPGYELVFLGTFPNARYMMASVYDDHLVPIGNILDSAMVPLASNMTNPFTTGATFKPNQIYGFRVTFGGGNPVNVASGCGTANTDLDKNIMDASQIHQGLTWTGYPNLPSGFPVHETGLNAAGVVMIRKYADIDSPLINEEVIVRSLSNGCAIPIQQAIQSNIVSKTQTLSSSWLHQDQISAHSQFSQSIEPWMCYPSDPLNGSVWMRTTDYIPLDNIYDGVLKGTLTAKQIQTLFAGYAYLRVRFQVPTTPNMPCATGNCSLAGNEQIRYFSFSLQGPALNVAGPLTLLAVGDQNLVKDPNGNVTIIVGFNAPRPSNVTAANYYTWIDATTTANINLLSALRIRNILPNQSFACSSLNVPFRTTEYNPDGGYMGNYVPTVDLPTAAQIPTLPVPVSRPNTCFIVPTQTPQICSRHGAIQ